MRAGQGRAKKSHDCAGTDPDREPALERAPDAPATTGTEPPSTQQAPVATATHPVDEVLPAPKLFTLGLQHVLVMYAGAIAVPLIIGRALQLPPGRSRC